MNKVGLWVLNCYACGWCTIECPTLEIADEMLSNHKLECSKEWGLFP